MTFWPWAAVMNFLSCVLTSTNFEHPMTICSWVTMLKSLCFRIMEPTGHCTCAVSCDLSVRVSISHIFETSNSYLCIHFGTCEALQWRLTRVIHQNSIQTTIKANKFSVHATWPVGRSEVGNNHIFGIPNPNLPIHHTTFMRLWWRLGTFRDENFIQAIFGKKNLKCSFWPNVALLGIFGEKY